VDLFDNRHTRDYLGMGGYARSSCDHVVYAQPISPPVRTTSLTFLLVLALILMFRLYS
jgi:hypothetical protein